MLQRCYDDAWEWLAARLVRLGDEEYRWEPTRSAWNVRPAGGGTAERADSHPDPAPVTTIAWRT